MLDFSNLKNIVLKCKYVCGEFQKRPIPKRFIVRNLYVNDGFFSYSKPNNVIGAKPSRSRPNLFDNERIYWLCVLC